jgi:hypothetical protein
MQIGSEKLRDEIAGDSFSICKHVEPLCITHMSSRGEMKMSLREMTCANPVNGYACVSKADRHHKAHILVSQMLQ